MKDRIKPATIKTHALRTLNDNTDHYNHLEKIQTIALYHDADAIEVAKISNHKMMRQSNGH